MSPRRYDRRLRQAAAEETRRRIVRATAELHAERGPLGTRHAAIAERAGVSVPTVYHHFPTAEDLIPACTGLAAAHAPLRLDRRLFAGARGAPERLRRLADAVFRLRAYYAPWTRWIAEGTASPALREFLAAGRRAVRRLIRAALPPGVSDDGVDLAEVLLDAASHRLLTAGGRPTPRAAALVADALIALCRKEKP
jgi:AcrR family transcriptional regulator